MDVFLPASPRSSAWQRAGTLSYLLNMCTAFSQIIYMLKVEKHFTLVSAVFSFQLLLSSALTSPFLYFLVLL